MGSRCFFIHSVRVATSSIFLEELSQERGRGGLGCQVEHHGGQENDKQVAEKSVHLQEFCRGNLINRRCGSPNFAYTSAERAGFINQICNLHTRSRKSSVDSSRCRRARTWWRSVLGSSSRRACWTATSSATRGFHLPTLQDMKTHTWI